MAHQTSKLKRALSRLRSIFILDPLIYLYTIVLGTLSLLSSLFDRSGRIQHGFARVWSWLILKTILSPVTVTGAERLGGPGARIYASNHLSALDIPVLYVNLRFPFRIMAKKELFRYPFMGWHLRRSGQIPIDASSALASMRSLNRASESLKGGMPLVVFPEGGRSADGHLRPFLAGAFYVAIKAQAEVVPIALVGSYDVLPMNSFHIRPGRIELLVGEPIPSAGYSKHDAEKLAARVHEAIADLYYSRASLPDPRKASSAAG